MRSIARSDSRVKATPACQPISMYADLHQHAGTARPNDRPLSSSTIVERHRPQQPGAGQPGEPARRRTRDDDQPTINATLRYQGSGAGFVTRCFVLRRRSAW